MKILLVENEMPAANRLIELLRRVDRTLVVADIVETVEDAVTKLQEGPLPDLILMDIQLERPQDISKACRILKMNKSSLTYPSVKDDKYLEEKLLGLSKAHPQ